MKEPCEEGVANHSTLSFAVGIARCLLKRKQGHRWAGYRASKNCNQDADAVVKAEGARPGAIARASGRSGTGLRREIGRVLRQRQRWNSSTSTNTDCSICPLIYNRIEKDPQYLKRP